jgi:hypothetical protein
MSLLNAPALTAEQYYARLVANSAKADDCTWLAEAARDARYVIGFLCSSVLSTVKDLIRYDEGGFMHMYFIFPQI